MYNEAEV